MSFPSDKRNLSNWADGFAKLHSLKFDGNKVYFSGKMIQSTTYMDSVKNNRLVPQFTLSPFENAEEEWSRAEVLRLFARAYSQFLGNMNHNMV